MENFCFLCNNILIVRNIFWDCSKDIAAIGISFAIQRAALKIQDSVGVGGRLVVPHLLLCTIGFWAANQCLLQQLCFCIEGLNLVTFGCLNNVEPFPVITPAHEFIPLSLDILNQETDRKNRMPLNPGSLQRKSILIIGWNIHFFQQYEQMLIASVFSFYIHIKRNAILSQVKQLCVHCGTYIHFIFP